MYGAGLRLTAAAYVTPGAGPCRVPRARIHHADPGVLVTDARQEIYFYTRYERTWDGDGERMNAHFVNVPADASGLKRVNKAAECTPMDLACGNRAGVFSEDFAAALGLLFLLILF